MAKNIVRFEGALAADTRAIINNNLSDVALSTAQVDVTSSTTLVNATGMVTDELAPGTYRFRIHLSTTANAAGGLKVGLKFGTPSMLTSIESSSRAFTASAVAVSRVTTATDAASLIASTSAVINAVIEGTLVVAVAGTLQVQFAQNASNAAATSVYAGSYLEFNRVGN